MDTTRSIGARALNTRMRLNMQATGCVSAVHSFPSSVKRWNEVDTRHGIKGTQFFNGVIKLEPQKQSYEINQSKIIRRCSYAASSPAPAQASSPSRTQVLKIDSGEVLVAHLLIDAMGNFSPIVKQIRSKKKPDGVCLVVGSCARGFKQNSTSDIIYSNSSTIKVGESTIQYFWEAFPAGSGPLDRTTYLFTYVDAQPSQPSLEQMLEDYWDLMPSYQGVKLDDLEILRVIFGIFPTYRESPLPAAFDRILQVGDASGIQSPISFGGFGSMARHLNRLSNGIYEAVTLNLLDSCSLSLLNPYMPNLSAAWLFQRAMSVQPHAKVSAGFINELLSVNFQCMQKLGDPVLRPFLQDVIQFVPLVKTLGLIMLTHPQILPSIFLQVGFSPILEWMGHFVSLGSYTFLSSFISPLLRPWVNGLPEKEKYLWNRRLEAWQYGAGLDYKP